MNTNPTTTLAEPNAQLTNRTLRTTRSHWTPPRTLGQKAKVEDLESATTTIPDEADNATAEAITDAQEEELGELDVSKELAADEKEDQQVAKDIATADDNDDDQAGEDEDEEDYEQVNEEEEEGDDDDEDDVEGVEDAEEEAHEDELAQEDEQDSKAPAPAEELAPVGAAVLDD